MEILKKDFSKRNAICGRSDKTVSLTYSVLAYFICFSVDRLI
jgi:hypothetical protein